jgi:exosortase
VLKKRNREANVSDKPAQVASAKASPKRTEETPAVPATPLVPKLLAAGAIVFLLATLWAYWPMLCEMVYQWSDQPDYSHGFLVIPLALFFLWTRRGKIAIESLQPSWWGAAILLGVAIARLLASFYFLGPIDAWTFPLWLMGGACLLFGARGLWWSWPALAFLWFMIPIPYSAERVLSLPLQRIATKASTEALVTLGQPALAEGNTIWIGDNRLGVEEACSGIRILFGIYALAFAFVLLSRWTWWQKGLALLAALPVAIIANVTRIVVTGLLYQFTSSAAAHRFMHDFSGLAMIPLAALLFWLFLVYVDRLFPEVEAVSSLEASQAGFVAQGKNH